MTMEYNKRATDGVVFRWRDFSIEAKGVVGLIIVVLLVNLGTAFMVGVHAYTVFHGDIAASEQRIAAAKERNTTASAVTELLTEQKKTTAATQGVREALLATPKQLDEIRAKARVDALSNK